MMPKQSLNSQTNLAKAAQKGGRSDSRTCKQVAAGIIIHEGKVLIGQRRRGKDLEFLWELPGGKLESGETLQQCLERELMEEMNLKIEVGDFFMRSSFDYAFGSFVINVFFAFCPNPEISDITQHEQYSWVKPEELLDYQFSPADIPVIKAYIKQALG